MDGTILKRVKISGAEKVTTHLPWGILGEKSKEKSKSLSCAEGLTCHFPSCLGGDQTH